MNVYIISKYFRPKIYFFSVTTFFFVKLKPEHYGLKWFFTNFSNPFSKNQKSTQKDCV